MNPAAADTNSQQSGAAIGSERDYSVLMAVYWRESPVFLDEALQSIYTQTWPPREIVLVKDGPLTAELEATIAAHVRAARSRFVVVVLERNQGLGTALQTGLMNCSCLIVARMDADDIAIPSRCEKQLRFLDEHSEVDAVGSWIAEFEADEKEIQAYRLVPAEPRDVARFARKRNPFNHMTVMMRKSAALQAGGYRPFTGFEDYYLWVRMLLNGSKLANLPECLVNVRAGLAQIERRGGWNYARAEINFQCELRRLRFTGSLQFFVNCLLRAGVRIVPVQTRRLIYRLIRRIREL